MTVIEVSALTKVYDGGHRGSIMALDGVSLEIRSGEIFGLLGPNGAGKTTLFRILLGMISSSSGEVLLDGLPPSDFHSRQQVGYLPENHRFPGHVTGLGLLELSGRLCGMSKTELGIRCESLLSLVGMDKWGNTRIKKYSKGMAQRIGLAQAMINDPDILMLDEPTDGIDPVGKLEIRQLLQQLRDAGKTIVINSHLLSEIELAADRVAILNYGRLVRIGTVAELTARKCQYEVEGKIGDAMVEISPEIGKVVIVSADRLVVELTHEDRINDVIDLLRSLNIKIHSIKPVAVSLEQSFFETVRPKGGV